MDSMLPKLEAVDVKTTQTRDDWKMTITIRTSGSAHEAHAAFAAGAITSALFSLGFKPCDVTANFS